MKRRQFDKVDGFTMVEVVVAISIVGFSMASAFGVLRSSAAGQKHCVMVTRAVLLAEKLLNETIVNDDDIGFEVRKGSEGKFGWEVETAMTPVDGLAAVCARVKWDEQGREENYQIFSLVYLKSRLEGK